MRIYLCRHAHAVGPGPSLMDDHRYLSPAGREQAARVGQVLGERVRFDAVVTSPLARAVQTAEILSATVGFTGVVEALPSLAPGAPPRVAIEELSTRGVSVLVVGHEPVMTQMGAILAGARSFRPFRTAQVALIDEGRLAWILDPDSLRFEGE